MKDHDYLKELLPLGAAGALSEAERAEVARHIAQCPSCAGELEQLKELVPELAKFPVPAVPVWLPRKTILLVKQRRRAIEDRRWNNRLLAFLVAFSWLTSLASWPIVHLVAGAGLLSWLAFSVVFGWITAGSAALIIRSHHSSQSLKGEQYESLS